MLTRLLAATVLADLKEKMVLVSGPRQSGKTTMARAVLRGRHAAAATRYLNWDDGEARTRILARQFPPSGLIVFDELHKFARWRTFLKGVFDTHRDTFHVLVTGSGRLDLYRRGGDSLQGRYHHLRLYPLSVKEAGCTVSDLLTFGPFPEPLLKGSLTSARRWSRQYRSQVIREDVASLERIDEMGALEQLSVRLPDLVGSPLSINALREGLQVAHRSVDRWLDLLERLMFVFRLLPFGPPKIKAVKKSRKHYLYDWTPIQDQGPRFENLVGFHLLKECHYLEDVEGEDAELRFFRDIEGREVDFVQLRGRTPVRFVECKVADTEISAAFVYLKRKFPNTDAIQTIATPGVDRVARDSVRLVSADRFLSELRT